MKIHLSYNKACINIANDLLWQTENEPSCPNFYDDCIKLWKKALNYVISIKEQLSGEWVITKPTY